MYSDYFSDLFPAARPLLRIETHRDTTPRRLAMFGELDAATADHLREAVTEMLRAELLRDGTPDVVELDLAGLTFADSAGARCLLGCRDNAQRAGRRLRLLNPCPAVREVLEVTGAIQLFEVTGVPVPTGVAPTAAPRRRGRFGATYRDATATGVDARAVRQAAQQARERAQDMRREDEARRARIRAARGY